jgi:hypothetical protein
VVGEYQQSSWPSVLGNFTAIAAFGEVRIEDRDGAISCRVEVSESLPDELRDEIEREER